jgi:LasA protease
MASLKQTSFNVSRSPVFCIAAILSMLTLVSLACSLGGTAASDPIFTAKGGNYILTQTAAPTKFPFDPPTLEPTLNPIPITQPEGESTMEPTPTQAPDAPLPVTDNPPILYYTQAGDTLPVVAVRFGVDPAEITSPNPIPETSLISPNQLLIIPDRFTNTTPAEKILPDSEIVFGPSAMDFDINTFINEAGGYLSTYRDYLGSTGWTSGADIVWRVGLENSINPRLLLALLEYQSGWVYGQPTDLLHTDYPMGKVDISRKQLYLQLAWAVNELSIGYYGWREGLLTNIEFPDGVSTPRLAPELNAGSVALQYYLSKVYDTAGWIQSLDPKNGLPGLYERMFGSPWARAQEVEPLIPAGMTQPRMILPFFIGQMWSYTGGPHGAWEKEGSRAALDFAPASSIQGCSETWDWALAMAPGLVVRSGNGVVVIDLDGDGHEQTGWAVLYLHIATKDRIELGTWVETGDMIGHPSCEGGHATGRHIHIARKYNGEWIPADGPLPFVLSGWTVHAGSTPYLGTMTRNGETITASVFGSYESRITRDRDEP